MCAWCVCVSFFHIHIKIAYAALSSCTGHKTHFTHTSIISMCICTHNRPIYCIHLAIFERRKKSILYTRNYMKLAFVNLFLSPSLSIFFFFEGVWSMHKLMCVCDVFVGLFIPFIFYHVHRLTIGLLVGFALY